LCRSSICRHSIDDAVRTPSVATRINAATAVSAPFRDVTFSAS
jgi:hypothetical protein